MSEPIGTYTFLPWLRRGIANRIGTAPAAGPRATIKIAFDIEFTRKGGQAGSEPIEQPIPLYGPGDIVGIESDQILRTDPRHWVTNFEPNYLAAIEFKDEDFPWRYTPAAPNGRRLLPWLALVVLEEGKEFREGGSIAGKPLPFIEVTGPLKDVMPPAGELWAWAHVHLNEALSGDVVATNSGAVSKQADAVLAARPDHAYSRILCPRKLAPDTAYHAFLIPAFESGRLAGLNVEQAPLFGGGAANLAPTASAWGTYPGREKQQPTSFPYYHRWFFRTGSRGDFEYLVRLLKPRPANSRIGHRDMDVSKPAPNISGIDQFDGALPMGGALKAPFGKLPPAEQTAFKVRDEWAKDYPQPFQRELATFVNLADGYQDKGIAAHAGTPLVDPTTGSPDPMITPPIYGRWHALTERLLTERDGSDVPNRENWVHQLNLDPRWRTAAGLGTAVIQKGQEEYMAAAWQQIGDVLEANRRIRQAQIAKEAGSYWHKRQIAKLAAVSNDDLFMFYAPMHSRVVSDGQAVRHRVRSSALTPAMTSSALRRMLRPGARAAKKLGLSGSRNGGDLISRVNDGEISAAPPKIVPPALPTPDAIADGIKPQGAGAIWAVIGKWLRAHPLLAALILLLLLFLLFLVALVTPGGALQLLVLLALLLLLIPRALSAAKQAAEAGKIKEEDQTPESVGTLPGSSGFSLTTPVDPLTPAPAAPAKPGQTDNDEGKRFKRGLRDIYTIIQESEKLGRVPKDTPIDIARVSDDLIKETDPAKTIPRWLFTGIAIPKRIRDQMGEGLVEAMAYPEIDVPMYRPLVDAGNDVFVPNLNLVEPDSVTVLETNQRFIESYMIGLNHEFARELLWREYPTDQRGSYFRQFWDPRTHLTAGTSAAARDKLKDIPPIDTWQPISKLGDHDNREADRENEEELVLVIRGELLKKYPNTIVTAQKAKWQPKSATDKTPDKTKERLLDDAAAPMTPLYEARVAPDIYFFGFDLTELDACGDDTVGNKPGWFFCLSEVPGDPRFGFDLERTGQLNVWNDLSWTDVMPTLVDGKHITLAGLPSRTLTEPTSPDVQEKRTQWDSDRHVPFDGAVSAAELAYIALQTPVIMAIHASELLPKGNSGG